jgi:hypothetical protein
MFSLFFGLGACWALRETQQEGKDKINTPQIVMREST